MKNKWKIQYQKWGSWAGKRWSHRFARRRKMYLGNLSLNKGRYIYPIHKSREDNGQFLIDLTHRVQKFCCQWDTSSHYPQDDQFYIHSITTLYLNTLGPLQREATVSPPCIPPWEPKYGWPCDLVMNPNSKIWMAIYCKMLSSTRVTINEAEDGLDEETILMSMFLAGFCAMSYCWTSSTCRI